METDRDLTSDAQLIFAAGDDPDAFRCFYDRYARRLHRFFVRRCGKSDAAVDLTAETFAQAWNSKRRFRDVAGGAAALWLFTIARRVLLKSVARRRLETTMLEHLRVEWPTAQAEHAVPDKSWLDGMDADHDAALAALPNSQRRALELRVVAGLPYAAIARELACFHPQRRESVSPAASPGCARNWKEANDERHRRTTRPCGRRTRARVAPRPFAPAPPERSPQPPTFRDRNRLRHARRRRRVALATSLLKSAADEETGMTEGYQLFGGSRPHCVGVTVTSFHCTLATAPTTRPSTSKTVAGRSTCSSASRPKQSTSTTASMARAATVLPCNTFGPAERLRLPRGTANTLRWRPPVATLAEPVSRRTSSAWHREQSRRSALV
jgi:RNA polymerase sigma factor (sigma-70 family)